MTCPRCARELEVDSTYCRYCGASVVEPSPPVPPVRRTLRRLPASGRIAGVCAGLAEYFDVDVTLVRLAWIILTIFPGALIGGVLAYLGAWLIMPEGEPLPGPRPARLARSTADRKIAGVCGGIAAYFGIDSTLVRVVVVILSIYPGAVIFGVIGYLIAWLVMPDGTEPTLEPSPTTL
jgi:phage shock protein PspC (stress-responsive transcriptional regulator)